LVIATDSKPRALQQIENILLNVADDDVHETENKPCEPEDDDDRVLTSNAAARKATHRY
jgi:hypothetical protein